MATCSRKRPAGSRYPGDVGETEEAVEWPTKRQTYHIGRPGDAIYVDFVVPDYFPDVKLPLSPALGMTDFTRRHDLVVIQIHSQTALGLFKQGHEPMDQTKELEEKLFPTQLLIWTPDHLNPCAQDSFGLARTLFESVGLELIKSITSLRFHTVNQSLGLHNGSKFALYHLLKLVLLHRSPSVDLGERQIYCHLRSRRDREIQAKKRRGEWSSNKLMYDLWNVDGIDFSVIVEYGWTLADRALDSDCKGSLPGIVNAINKQDNLEQYDILRHLPEEVCVEVARYLLQDLSPVCVIKPGLASIHRPDLVPYLLVSHRFKRIFEEQYYRVCIFHFRYNSSRSGRRQRRHTPDMSPFSLRSLVGPENFSRIRNFEIKIHVAWRTRIPAFGTDLQDIFALFPSVENDLATILELYSNIGNDVMTNSFKHTWSCQGTAEYDTRTDLFEFSPPGGLSLKITVVTGHYSIIGVLTGAQRRDAWHIVLTDIVSALQKSIQGQSALLHDL